MRKVNLLNDMIPPDPGVKISLRTYRHLRPRNLRINMRVIRALEQWFRTYDTTLVQGRYRYTLKAGIKEELEFSSEECNPKDRKNWKWWWERLSR